MLQATTDTHHQTPPSLFTLRTVSLSCFLPLMFSLSPAPLIFLCLSSLQMYIYFIVCFSCLLLTHDTIRGGLYTCTRSRAHTIPRIYTLSLYLIRSHNPLPSQCPKRSYRDFRTHTQTHSTLLIPTVFLRVSTLVCVCVCTCVSLSLPLCNLFICACAINHSYVCHDVWTRVPWLIHICFAFIHTTSHMFRLYSHHYAWYKSFMCVPWRIHTCDSNESYLHDHSHAVQVG